MKKVGFIMKNIKKVNGREYEYFYLRRSDRIKGAFKDGKYPKKQINIYNFGNRNKAISQLVEWEHDINEMPEKLREMGYSLEDVLFWKKQILNK